MEIRRRPQCADVPPEEEINYLLARDHLVLRREHPRLEDALTRACARGRLARVLPGVYADPGRVEDPVLRMAAVCAAVHALVGEALPSAISAMSSAVHAEVPALYCRSRSSP